MNILILGCGRVGSELAKLLSKEGNNVTVVDKDRNSFRRLGKNFKGKTVGGMGIDQDILKKAGIEKANIFIAVTNGDNTNVMASQIAKEIFNVPIVITRIYDPLRAESYREMGLNTFCPTKIGVTIVKNMILNKELTTEKIVKLIEEAT
jgi:trk system potassium uptake protein TrkA